jgi:diguanylate cyclase (GGDEF)-like protein
MTGRLLILDDDEIDRKAFLRALERAGWDGEIVQSSTSDEALAHVRQQPFDCILLDYRLPGEDGLDVLTRLRSEGNTTPIIMLTGEGNETVAVEAMKRGAFDYLPKSQIAADTLYRSVAKAIERARLQKELADAQRLLERQALYDALSGLGNRNLFMRDLEHRVASARRLGTSFAILLMDLDRFKLANDTYGHEAGDAILADFGRRVTGVGRSTDVFYRLGGDEFTAILDTAEADTVPIVSEKLQTAMKRPFMHGSNAMSVGVSIGSARFPEDGETADKLLRNADAAMYRVKSERRGAADASR